MAYDFGATSSFSFVVVPLIQWTATDKVIINAGEDCSYRKMFDFSFSFSSPSGSLIVILCVKFPICFIKSPCKENMKILHENDN